MIEAMNRLSVLFLVSFSLPLLACGNEDDSADDSDGSDDADDTDDDTDDDADDTDDGTDDGDDSTGGGDDDPVACEGDVDDEGNLVVVARDVQNFAFQSSMEIQTEVIQPHTDFTIDWSAVDTDMLGHPLDPMQDVSMMSVMLWQYTRDELLEHMDNDSLDTQYVVAMGYIWTENDQSSGQYLEVLSPSGQPWPADMLLEFMDPEVYPSDTYTYFTSISNPMALSFGTETRMIKLFTLDPESENTTISLTNDSTIIDYSADLRSLAPVQLPAGTANVVFDWSDDEILTTTGKGQAFVPNKITDVMIAHYADKTPAELEQEFLDLEIVADDLYRVFLTAGQNVNLSELENESGNTFQGIDDQGTWILALVCGTCMNPAPWYVTILQPCDE